MLHPKGSIAKLVPLRGSQKGEVRSQKASIFRGFSQFERYPHFRLRVLGNERVTENNSNATVKHTLSSPQPRLSNLGRYRLPLCRPKSPIWRDFQTYGDRNKAIKLSQTKSGALTLNPSPKSTCLACHPP